MAHCIGPLVSPEEEQGPLNIALAHWPLQRRSKEHWTWQWLLSLVHPEEEQGQCRIAVAHWSLQRRCKDQRGLKLAPVLGYKRAYYRQHRNPSGPSALRIWLDFLKL